MLPPFPHPFAHGAKKQLSVTRQSKPPNRPIPEPVRERGVFSEQGESTKPPQIRAPMLMNSPSSFKGKKNSELRKAPLFHELARESAFVCALPFEDTICKS